MTTISIADELNDLTYDVQYKGYQHDRVINEERIIFERFAVKNQKIISVVNILRHWLDVIDISEQGNQILEIISRKISESNAIMTLTLERLSYTPRYMLIFDTHSV
jgi:hypothetical protein